MVNRNTVVVMIAAVFTVLLISYIGSYCYVRQSQGVDGFSLHYDGLPKASAPWITSIHRPLIWLESRYHIRVYIVPKHKLDSESFDSAPPIPDLEGAGAE